MKKALFAVIVAGFAMTSCVKSYTCECTVTEKSTGEKDVTNYPITAKKKDAKSTCDKLADGDMTTYTETCDLK